MLDERFSVVCDDGSGRQPVFIEPGVSLAQEVKEPPKYKIVLAFPGRRRCRCAAFNILRTHFNIAPKFALNAFDRSVEGHRPTIRSGLSKDVAEAMAGDANKVYRRWFCAQRGTKRKSVAPFVARPE